MLQLIKTFEKINNISLNYEFTEKRNGDLEKIFANVDKSYIELNWKCEKTLEDICIDGYNYYMKNIIT